VTLSCESQGICGVLTKRTKGPRSEEEKDGSEENVVLHVEMVCLEDGARASFEVVLRWKRVCTDEGRELGVSDAGGCGLERKLDWRCCCLDRGAKR